MEVSQYPFKVPSYTLGRLFQLLNSFNISLLSVQKLVKYSVFMIRALSFIGLSSVIQLAKKPLSGQRE